MVPLYFILCITCFIFVTPKTIRQKLSFSKTESYTTIPVNWGTPPQGPFSVLLDTTSDISIVLNQSIILPQNTKQNKFNPKQSSSFDLKPQYVLNYSYYNTTLKDCHYGKDSLSLAKGKVILEQQDIGLAEYNPLLFEVEIIDGVLGISPDSTIATDLAFNQNSLISINIDEKKIGFKPINKKSHYHNSTDVKVVDHTNITTAPNWMFAIDSVYTNEFKSLSGKIYGVIDTASPFITMFTPSYSMFETFFVNLVGIKEKTGLPNCNISSLLCKDTKEIKNLRFDVNTGNDSIWLMSDKLYMKKKKQKHILLRYGGTTKQLLAGRKIIDYNYNVFFFGKPFLTDRTIELYQLMDVEKLMITINFNKGGSEPQWNLILAAFAIVVGSAVCFFGVFFWKYKIPKAQVRNQESQGEQFLLGSSNAAVNPVYNQQLLEPDGNPNNATAPPIFSGGIDDGVGAEAQPLVEDRDTDSNDAELQAAILESARLHELEQNKNIHGVVVTIDDDEDKNDGDNSNDAVADVSNGSRENESNPATAEDLRQRRLKYLQSLEQNT